MGNQEKEDLEKTIQMGNKVFKIMLFIIVFFSIIIIFLKKWLYE